MLSVNNTTKGVDENMVVVPIAEAPFQFIQVPVKVLGTDLVECSDDASLEQGPDAFDAIGMNVTHSPFLSRVVNSFVSGVLGCNAQVRSKFVCVNGFRFVFDCPSNEVMQCLAFGVGDTLQANAAISLNSTSNPSLVALVGSSFALSPTANQGFVYLNDSQEGWPIKGVVAHCLTDAMAEIPSSLVGYAQCPLELKRAYALLGFAHQVNGDKPLAEGQMGIVHDGSGCDGELIAASIAVELPTSLNLGYSEGPAPGTGYPVGPTKPLQEFSTLGVCVKVVHEG